MKLINKRIISLLLALVMLVGMMPITVFAVEESETNPWSGRSAVFVGDSITAGTGTTQIYYQYLEESLGLGSVTSMGVGGSCISAASDYSTGNQPLISRYQNIPSTDLIVIFMGTNDYGHETPLGSVEDTKDGTFYGALNTIIPALVTKHTSSKIVFVTPLHRYGFGTSKLLGTKFTYDNIPNGVGATLGDYVDALKTVCANNGVSVIDLHTECTLDPSDAAVRSTYMPDGLHPNAAGHELIAGIMESHIRSYEPVKIEPIVQTELIQGNKFSASNDQPCRASSRVNYYLKAGTVITLRDPDAMQWACAKTNGEISSTNLGYFPDSQWTDKETAVVAEDGWVGFVFKYRDETKVFDLTKPLSEYITIEEPHTHSYESTVTAPTCTEQGYTTYTCECGDSYVDDHVDATGHNYENGTCTDCGAAQWDTDGDGVLEILAIGNSFSVDALQYVYQIAQNLGIEEIVIGNLYKGSCTLEAHAKNAKNNTAAYAWFYNDNGTWSRDTNTWKDATEKTMGDALQERTWDFVSLQQASGSSGQPDTYNADLDDLIQYVSDNAPGAKLVWHMTWAYQQNTTHSAFPTYGKDQMTMYNAIVSAVQSKIVTNGNFDLIVPNGTAVQNSRTSLLGDTTTIDGYHMSRPYGRYLTSLMFVKAITGMGISDISYMPSGVSAEEKQIAIESVNNAYKTHFAVAESAYQKETVVIPEGYVQQNLGLTALGYWNSSDKNGDHNKIIATADNSKQYYATVQFTREQLPVGSVILLADGWQYRPEGWITDAVNTNRPVTTTESYVVITEEWWSNYTLRAFNISKAGLSSLSGVTEADICEAFQIYVPTGAHIHTYTPDVTAPTCTEQGYTTYTCACGDSYVEDYVDAADHNYAEGTCTVCGEADPDYSEPAWGTWVAFGTSITEDKDYMRPNATNIMGTYIPYLSELMGVDAPDANYSIGGAAFSTHLLMYIYYAKYQKNGLTYNGYTHTAIKNADLITIEGGVNDFYGSVPLGKVGDTVPYSKADPISVNPNSTNNFGGTTDGTFAGCIYAAITELRRVAPDATIVFITDNAGTGSCAATKANALGHYLHDYNDMMTAVAESMGCYVIDAGRTAGFEENLKTYLSDHIHQSEAGGEAYANAIWRGLCAIRNGEQPESGHTHRYTESVTAPTCTEQGYTTYTCVCGDSYVDDYVAATGDHTYENGVCTSCGSVSEETVANGTCGDALTWMQDKNGVLTISGTGEMYDYGYRAEEGFVVNPPWNAHKNEIITVVIGDGITNIGNAAFASCANLTGIVFSDTITDIGYQAFSNCSSLANVTLPESLNRIEDFAFIGCSSMESIRIPAAVTGIGSHAFSNCSGLTAVELPNGIVQISERTFNGCRNLAAVKIPTGVTGIGDYAFFGCKSLETVELPNGLVNIGDYAFGDCAALTDIVLPESLVSIGNSAFSTCSSLTGIVIPDAVTELGNSVFYNCYNLKNVELPANITSIGEWVFYGCGLTSIDIPDSVTHINDYAFYSCDYLTSVEIPENVVSIGVHAFCDCIRLTSIKLPDGLESIGNGAFERCASLDKITFTGDAPSIAESAFANVTATVYYPAGNATWTANARQNYGASALTWTSYCEHTYENGICTACGEIEAGGIWQIVENNEVIGAYADLQSAIDACEAGGTVRLTANCSVTSGVKITKDITIDGGNFLVDISGCVKEFIHIGKDTAVTLRDLKLDGGATGFEVDYDAVTYTNYTIPLKVGSLDKDPMAETSAILSFGKHLICDNVDISNRYTASYGAAMQIRSGRLELTDCDFTHNYGSKQGGALYIGNGFGSMTEYPISSVTISNCNFTENYSGHGGAIYAMNVAQMSITNSLFDRNTANGGKGGAIDLPGQNVTKPVAKEKGLDYMQTTIHNCVFSNNWAGNDGFAIQSYDSELYITDTEFVGNVGVHPTSSVGTVSIEHYRGDEWPLYVRLNGCLFEGNQGPCAAYGDHDSPSELEVSNCTFRGNKGNMSVLLYSSTSNFTNCQFVNETMATAVIDARSYSNYQTPPKMTLTDVSFTDCDADAEILTRKQDHNDSLNTYQIVLQGTTNGDIVMQDNNRVSVEGTHTGDVLLDRNTDWTNLAVNADAAVNGIIVKQPMDGEAKLGERYMVEVKAEGEGLKYQWYFLTPGSTVWYKSSVKDNTYDDVMTTARAGREVYCVITDAKGNSVTTETAKLICLPSEELAIITQPTDGEAVLGERYCVTVEAKGEGLKYQWYFRNKGTNYWTKSSVTDNTYDDVMTTARDGREVYCVITDLAGNKVTTDVVKLVRVPMKLEIVTQPTDATAPFGEMFCATVEAKGEGLKYQWYYRNAGGLIWHTSGVHDNTYDDIMNKSRNGREVYCVITDKYGNSVTTDTAKLIAVPKVELKLLGQTYESADMSERYCVTVEAEGEGLTYQWYFRNAGGKIWYKSGVRDNTYDDVMTKARANRDVYCVITDAFGNQVTTEVVTLTVEK